MTRRRRVARPVVQQLVQNVDLTSIIAVAVSEYQELPDLDGVAFDLEMIEDLFAGDKDLAVYKPTQLTLLENPTSSQFRKALISYAVDRSARGDVVILYFSGHGAVLKDGGFAFCLKDTRLGYHGNGVLPVSVVAFHDVATTLASFDIHPMFIIDACFGGSTAPQGYAQVAGGMQAQVHSVAPNSYALLAAASPVSAALDTPEGGGFTQGLWTVASDGLADEAGRQFPVLQLDQLVSPLQTELSKQGHPLPKSHFGQYFPPVPISRNPGFRPDTETFTPYMKGIVKHLWNRGNPREVAIADIGKKLGPTEYANHRKLSLKPWALLEDGSLPRTRRLTSKGQSFAQTKASIPKKIIRDPLSWEWVSAPGAKRVKISDIK